MSRGQITVPQGSGTGAGAGEGFFGLQAFSLEDRFLLCLRKPCSVTPIECNRVGSDREVPPQPSHLFEGTGGRAP